MQLYEEVLSQLSTAFQFCAEEIIKDKCYQALEEIKAIVQDDSLSDPECFQRIEKIILVYEALGSNGGSRHDFG